MSRPICRRKLDKKRHEYVIESFTTEPSESGNIQSALNKFLLVCLKRYLALWKRKRKSKHKHVEQRSRKPKDAVVRRDVVSQDHLREIRKLMHLVFLLLSCSVVTVLVEVLRVSKSGI